MKQLHSYLALCRLPISIFSALSAAAGFLLASHDPQNLLRVAGAVFLLACGASMLNQIQERDIDARMPRTRQRPLPSGTLTILHAAVGSFLLILTGLFLLWQSGGRVSALTGIITVLWYNAVYTPLKRLTAFAFLPGAAVGMLTPAIGCAAGGGSLLDHRILLVCAIFFLWQVPHFLLLLIRYGDEYAGAGLPSLTRILTRSQIARVASIWIVAAAVGSLMLPMYGAIGPRVWQFAIIPAAAWMIWTGRTRSHQDAGSRSATLLFRKVNIYLILLLGLIILASIAR